MKVKFYEWKPEDSLKTPEAQKEFLAAAVEDGNGKTAGGPERRANPLRCGRETGWTTGS